MTPQDKTEPVHPRSQIDMADYDDGAYYEVQLNNKQLVFFFMAALAIAVVVFLCGVMVGRGVRDATLAVAQNDITASPIPKAAPAGRVTPPRPELDYTARLESDQVPDRLESVPSSSPEKHVEAARDNAPQPTPARVAATPPAATPPAPKAAASVKLGTEEGPFTIQVVALKTEEAANTLLSRLRGKNYRAYVEGGSDAGLHRVRVGRFQTRAEAEKVATMLREEEKFKPYITQ
jgi:cell division protein FtsN